MVKYSALRKAANKISLLNETKIIRHYLSQLPDHAMYPTSHLEKSSTGLPETMAKTYDPATIEPAVREIVSDLRKIIDQSKPVPNGSSDDPFSICLPPINVTGQLHLGHALTCAIHDTLIRLKTMKGSRRVNWFLGFDHAGIATEVRVSKQYNLDNFKDKSNFPYLRQWSEDKMSIMDKQLKTMGLCASWPERVGNVQQYPFTMDAKFGNAVAQAFYILHSKHNLIYRSERLVNWCPALKTAISDMETQKIDIEGPRSIQIPDTRKGANPTNLRSINMGRIWEISYPLWENSDDINHRDKSRSLTVFTTRPETMLADCALAVNPSDTRYTKYHNKWMRHPLYPYISKPIPVILDHRIDPTFGSGVMKVTPGHDLKDYSIACDYYKSGGILEKEDLTLNIFTSDGLIHDNVALIGGMDRFEARESILQYLANKNLLIASHDHALTIKVCTRSGDIVEAMPMPQWYLKCRGQLSEELIDKIVHDNLRILPEKPYGQEELIAWLNNIDDWCLSRQISWGHRIPAFYFKGDINEQIVTHCNEVKGLNLEKSIIIHNDQAYFIELSKEMALEKCHGIIKKGDKSDKPKLEDLQQDEDVFDTWFSSALYPMVITDYWPNGGSGYKQNSSYPLSLMETGYDIRHLWVARMLLLGLKLTRQLPFKEVLYHGIVNDSFGRKMSKSLGNVIDPMDVIQGATLTQLKNKLLKEPLSCKEKEIALHGQKELFPNGIPACGSDAMKMALLRNDITSQVIKIDVNRMEEYKKFGNKLWQAIRYVLHFVKRTCSDPGINHIIDPKRNEIKFGLDACHSGIIINLEDQWILHQLQQLICVCNDSFQNLETCEHLYNFHLAIEALQNFWLTHFCDTYIECTKSILYPILEYKESTKISNTVSALITMTLCANIALRLLHPYMPHLTQALWTYIPHLQSNKEQSSSNAIGFNKYPDSTDPFVEILPLIKDKNFFMNEINSGMSSIKTIAAGSKSLRTALNFTHEKPKLLLIKTNFDKDESVNSSPKDFEKIEDTIILDFLEKSNDVYFSNYLRLVSTLSRCSSVQICDQKLSNKFYKLPYPVQKINDCFSVTFVPE